MGDDNGHHHHLQTVPSCAMNSAKGHDMGTVPSKKRCASSPEPERQGNTPSSRHRPVHKDISRNDQASTTESSIGLDEVPDEQNESDQSCPSTLRDRSCRKDSNSSEMIDRKAVYFPHKDVILAINWYMYRINISGDHDLGFIVPCELPKLPRFYLYENGDPLQVHLMFLQKIDFQKCKDHLERFCRHIFEKVFDYMNTGSNSSLQFDLENSPFKLLPCFVTESGELDYSRMASICNRETELPVKLKDQELYIRSDFDSQIYFTVTDALLPSQASGPQRMHEKIKVKHFEKPSIDYLKKSSSSANKKQKTQSSTPETCSIKVFRYAPLNQMDLTLIYKLRSVLVRLVQVYPIEQLRMRRLLGRDIFLPYSPPVDADQMPVVTFNDCFFEMLSSRNVLPLDYLNYQLLLSYNCKPQLPPDLIFQSTTTPSTIENGNMMSLATLGDSFIKLGVSMSIYHQCPSDNMGQLTKRRSDEVSNSNLREISTKKCLKDYLNTTKITLDGSTTNWLPPGYTVGDKYSDRYLKQNAQQKAPADMIEALIAVFLVSTDHLTTIKFMDWLGLDVIPRHKDKNIIKPPSVFRIKETGRSNKIDGAVVEEYHKRSFDHIETTIGYTFENKAYLIAAFTHPSYSSSAQTINYRRLKFVGNPLFEYLITRHIFLSEKSITPGHIFNVRQKLTNNKRKNVIMKANNLHGKIIHNSFNLINEDRSINNKDIKQGANLEAVADVFDALIGAIFIDCNFSLKVVWYVIECLFRQPSNQDLAIENSNPHLMEYVRNKFDYHSWEFVLQCGEKFVEKGPDENGNFVCYFTYNGTEIEGSGKSKELARLSACNKLKRRG